ncbi:SprT family protein [Oceanobacillus halotolerans]|uniref:SprT family protein n=1 Tax=Oceanobacillus halotolerans TaxID=2663380 RepID=UPI0013D948FE|nr:SprT family protein [Oceanobacillus halotolerans]
MALLSEGELYKLVNDVSKKYFHKPFMDKVVYNNRLRTTGGRYLPQKKLIELNPKYMLEMDENEYIGIIKHELCHYHLHIEGKGYQHRDPEFKALLQKTNSPRYCNPLPSNRNTYKHTYKCKNCGQIYRRKRRVDISKYRCGKCKGELYVL